MPAHAVKFALEIARLSGYFLYFYIFLIVMQVHIIALPVAMIHEFWSYGFWLSLWYPFIYICRGM